MMGELLIIRMKKRRIRLFESIFMAVVFLAIGPGGCGEDVGIRLVPVFPNDEPNLLENAGVEYLDVEAELTQEGPEDEIVSQRLYPGDKLSMNLSPGTWQVTVKGMSGAVEVVHGQTAPFEVNRSLSSEVKFFVGRSMAFNEVKLESVDMANTLGELIGHSAVSYKDADGHPWILVAGGKRDVSGAPVSDAYLIDPLKFEIKQLPSMECTRAGHVAFTIETEQGLAVVLAGGDDGSCLGAIEVFNPLTESFHVLNACGLEFTRGAVPEIEVSGGTDMVQTGWVIVPGNPRCKVNVYDGQAVAGITLDPTAVSPKSPRASKVNAQGTILIVDQDRLFVDTQAQAQCIDTATESWMEDALWGEIEERPGGKLHAFSDGRFLFLGGRVPQGATQRFGWSMIITSMCSLPKVVEGERAYEQPLTGFVMIDLDLQSGVGLLAAGGYNDAGSRTDKAYLFIENTGALAPSWHDMSVVERSRTIQLRRPRAEAAAARMENGDYWILGGGATVPEIFVRGEEILETNPRALMKRSPTLTSVSVMDTAAPTEPIDSIDPSVNKLFKEKYVPVLYSQSSQFRNLLFFITSADRGVQDGLLASNPLGSEDCEENPPSAILGVFFGSESSVNPGEQNVEVFEGQGEVLMDSAKESAEVLVDNIAAAGGDCGWRQLLRAGREGMEMSVEVTEAGQDDPTLGVNILFLVTTEDDCSQRIYQGMDVTPVDPPPDAVLVSEECSSQSYDDYFGLPPTGEYLDAFIENIPEISWDPSDLIVVLFGHGGQSISCNAGDLGVLNRPRRLMETLEVMESQGVEIFYVNLCEDNTNQAVADRMGELLTKITDRNPYQACLSEGIVSQETEYDADRQQYKPVEPDKALADEVALRCQLLFLEEAADAGTIDDIPEHLAARLIDPDDTWIGTDSDRRAACPVDDVDDDPWVIRVGRPKTSDDKDVNDLDLICLP
jgi:hypothetical protein